MRESDPFKRFHEWFCDTDLHPAAYPGGKVATALLGARLSRLPTTAPLFLEAHRKPYDTDLQAAAGLSLAFSNLLRGNGYLPGDEDYNTASRSHSQIEEAIYLGNADGQDLRATLEASFHLVEEWSSLMALPPGSQEIAVSARLPATAGQSPELAGLRCRVLAHSKTDSRLDRIVADLQCAGADVSVAEVPALPMVADQWLCVGMKKNETGGTAKFKAVMTSPQQQCVFRLLSEHLHAMRLAYAYPPDGKDADPSQPDMVIMLGAAIAP